MRRLLLVIALLSGVCLAALAQTEVLAPPPEVADLADLPTPQLNARRNAGNSAGGDSLGRNNDRERQAIPLTYRMGQWRIDHLGNIRAVDADTLHHHFQNTQETDGINGQYNHTGNLGSPRLSRLFFERKETSEFLFLDPLDYFFKPTEEFNFTNTTIPYTNIYYHSAGNQTDGEDIFRTYFSVNAGPRTAFGFSTNYVYGRGVYNDQNTSLFNVSLFSSYQGDHYNLHFLFSNNHIKIAENGGIEDDTYITNPEDLPRTYSPSAIPTVLDNTWSRNDNFKFFLTHRYNMGFYRAPADSTQYDDDFIPVSSIIHTVNWEHFDRDFIAYSTPSHYYANDYLSSDSTFDNTRYVALKNTVALTLHEGFNKYAKAGLTAYLSHELRTFRLPDFALDGTGTYSRKYSDNLITLGGELAKRQGNTLHYAARAETYLTGSDAGDLRLEGDIDLNFRLLGDTLQLAANAYVKNISPTFYMQHYHSRHLWWDSDDMDREFRTRIEGSLSSKRWGTHLRVGVENLKNYTYLASRNTINGSYNLRDAAYLQCGENIQVLSATLEQNFRLGILHLDNVVTYQTSTNEDVLPLPTLNLYHNLYLAFKLAKVLSVEFGADVRYFTRYYAPDYLPAMGQFLTQYEEERMEIGCHPYVNGYVNMHLKRARIYFMVTHVNATLGTLNYFLAPHYPTNPMTIKWGISWNFLD